MCVVCGCSTPHANDLHFGADAARLSVPGMSTERAIKLEADVLGANDEVARRNRAHFAAHTAVRYSSMRSASCRSSSSHACCERWNRATSSQWAITDRSRSTFVSWLPPTEI